MTLASRVPSANPATPGDPPAAVRGEVSRWGGSDRARGPYSRAPGHLERDFLAARSTVASLRARQVAIRAALVGLDPSSLEHRHVNAELESVRGALDRANGALTAARARLERSEKRRAS